MTDAPALDHLHDATLLHVGLDWAERALSLRIRTHAADVVLVGEQVVHLDVPCRAPWGRSVSINRVRGPVDAGDGRRRIEVEMQSGDVIVAEGARFRVEETAVP